MWPRRSTNQTPAPADAQPEAGAALLRRLRWTVLRPLAKQLGGDERSLLRGSGLELMEIREYQPGDDVRQIDWNATARSDQVYIRETHTERALDVWLVLDVSASVDWGTADCLKRDRAAEFLTVAGELLGGHGNRLGALLFADRPLDIIPPGAGRAHLLHLLARLQTTPRQAAPGHTDLAAALVQLGRVLQRRALVLVVSDFLMPEGWTDALRRLAARHEVVGVRLADPREGELPDVGLLVFDDPETGDQLAVDTSDRRLRERFREAALKQSERIGRDLVGCGADHLVLSTGEPLLPALVRFLNARRQRRAQRGQRPAFATLPTGGVQ